MIIMGDLNIDTQNPKDAGFDALDCLCDTFNLKNLIKDKTCFTKTHKSSIDVIVTNRNYKNFNKECFLADVQKFDFSSNSNDPNDHYENLVENFRKIIDKHAPLKQKIVRGNNAPFMNSNLRKAIYTRTRLKNRYNKNPTIENEMKYKKQRNFCVNLRRKAIKEHLNKVTDNGIMTNKNFWQTVKPFITNKNTLTNNTIMLNHSGSIITEEEKIANTFNNHYINIVEKSTGIKPNTLGHENDDSQINEIIKKYENHPSILEIKKHTTSDVFSFKEIDENDLKRLFKEIKTDTSTGEDKIPPKLLKLAGQYLVKPLTMAINTSIHFNIFPTRAKIASVTPLDKGGKGKTEIGNYRPVSVLNVFSKFYERVIKSQIMTYFDNRFSEFLSAYRKHYNTQHVLMRLIEEWKSKIDKGYVVGAILLDLSKAFDCVPHELLLAKLHAYGFEIEALQYIFSYLSKRQQSTKINDTYSLLDFLISGVPQGSIIGPILFNIFLNDLFYFIKISNIHNYADDTTLSTFSNSVPKLIEVLEKETDLTLAWLKNNNMIANPEKLLMI